MEVGSSLDLEIHDVALGGDAVGRAADERAVFVPFAVVGDRLRVRLTQVHRRFARGEIEEILQPGAGRTVPRCPHFGRCGGCAYQHMDYSTEIEAKRHQFAETLSRLGGLSEVPGQEETPVLSPHVYGYRNKMCLEPLRREPLPGAAVEPGEATVEVGYGYCERDNKTFFALDQCPLAREPLNHLLGRVPQTPAGRRNAASEHPSALTLRVTRDGTTAFHFGRASRRVPWLHETLLGKPVSVPLGSFWQVNPEVADRLAATLAEWYNEAPTRTLVDAYCGVGTFSLAIAEAAHNRFLIENDRQALEAAAYNHSQWGNLDCQCRPGTTDHELPRLLAGTNRRRTTVLLDPPRQGCGPRVIRALCDFGPARVFYVSCHAATLARDVRRLCEAGGYRAVRAALFDMFPRTAHFESALWLER
ncbi:MAG: class I SAM-dependent RNA methyltransferase [Lentisphaeria bacterium]|nr:class I SAM-dependent RNA methyltransferase [Lentisphaeria bacterium]